MPSPLSSGRAAHTAPAWAQAATQTRIDLNDDVLRELARVGRRRQWRSGQTVVHLGASVDHVSVCVSGKFRVVINSVDGQSMLLRFLLRGEIFGMPSVFAGAPFPTDVICEESGEILDISRSAIEQVLHERPQLAVALIESLCVRVAELFALMEANLLPSLRARVHRRLLWLAQAHGEAQPSGQVRLHLSQQDIAQAVNASRQKVQVELKRLEREGLIRLGYRCITIEPGLRAAA